MMQIDTWCGVIVSAARPPCAQWQAPQSLSALYSLQATTNCSTSSAAWLKPQVPYLHGTGNAVTHCQCCGNYPRQTFGVCQWVVALAHAHACQIWHASVR